MKLTRRALVTSAVIMPVLASTQVVARQESDTDARSRVGAMLDCLPGGILDAPLEISWTDFETHFSKFPDLDADALFALAPGSEVSNLFSHRQDTADLLGLELTSVRHGIVSGEVPNKVTVLDMAGDVSGLPALWETTGYETRDLDGTPFWTIGEDGEIDINHPVNRIMIARANNLAIVNDSLVVMAPRAALLAEILDTIKGNRPGRAAELEPVISSIPQATANLWILNGEIVKVTDQDASSLLAESDDAVGPMPETLTIGIGQTAASTWNRESQVDDATGFIALQAADPTQAEQITTVVDWRLQNMVSGRGGIPFAEIVGPSTSEVVSEGVAVTSTTGAEVDTYSFVKIVTNRDIAPFAYIPQ